MSFLNPVNEPVLRFKSTDAGAPQINYNARVAGDVKAVLKACLVTGYGSVASAGWTAINEAGSAVEFVSPSGVMADYALGIDDASASSTTWYYQYQNSRVNPVNNAVSKTLTYTDKLSSENGWELLVTQRGILFIEITKVDTSAYIRARVTYYGALKSAITNSGKNIGFWSTGAGDIYDSFLFFQNLNTRAHYNLSSYTQLSSASLGLATLGNNSIKKTYNVSDITITSSIFLLVGSVIVAEQPAVLLQDVNKSTDVLVKKDILVDDRPCLYVAVGRTVKSSDSIDYSVPLAIRLDYWEY